MLSLKNSSLTITNMHTKCRNLLNPLTFHLFARSQTKGKQGVSILLEVLRSIFCAIHHLVTMSVTHKWIISWRAATAVQSLLISRKIFWFCICDEWHRNLLLIFSAIFRILITIKLWDYGSISPVYPIILYKEVQF